jgi:hypothetical protein
VTPGRRASLFMFGGSACSGFLMGFGHSVGASSLVLFLLTTPGMVLARKAGWWDRQTEVEESILAAFRRLGVPTDDEVQS